MFKLSVEAYHAILQSGSSITKNESEKKLRRQAFSRFEQLGFPHRKMENWKYTALHDLLAATFTLGEIEATHQLSTLASADRYSISPATLQKISLHPFANLALAIATETRTLEITQTLSSPRQLNYVIQKATASTIHQRIHLTENTSAEIILDYTSADDSAGFLNIVTEIILEKNAKLHLYKKQRLNHKSFLIDLFVIDQAQSSEFYSFTLDKGAHLSRTDFVINLNQSQATAQMYGIYTTIGEQVADHHSVIYHHASHCQSSQHYRGIVNHRSKAIFNGKIVIAQDAQKTSSKQLNKNLLLSNQAEVNTKPELEIYANDVKATHGATVGQLDEQALFYLQARGIEKTQAIELLTMGFLQAVLLNIPNQALQDQLIRELMEQSP